MSPREWTFRWIDMRILWKTVTKNLPALRVQLVELQRRFSPLD